MNYIILLVIIIILLVGIFMFIWNKQYTEEKEVNIIPVETVPVYNWWDWWGWYPYWRGGGTSWTHSHGPSHHPRPGPRPGPHHGGPHRGRL